MTSSLTPNIWDTVTELTNSAQNNGTDPLTWSIELSSTLISAGESIPLVELAELLVSHICWSNNVPIAWKFIEKAVSSRVVLPLLVLALLSSRVTPSRRSHPAAYRLYLELLKRHIFALDSKVNGQNYQKIMESIDDALHLNQIFGLQSCEPGLVLVEWDYDHCGEAVASTITICS